MAARRKRPPGNGKRSAMPAESGRGGGEVAAERIGRVAASLAVALLVTRPLFPSEDAESGSGLVLVALWGVVLTLWAMAGWARRSVRIHVTGVDFAAAVLLACVLASACWSDAPRPAINLAAEWFGLILSYFLVRQLFRSRPRQGALVSAMLATATCLAAYGTYQAFWGLEALRHEYAADSGKILESVGIAPGSPQQQLFENRLRSHEPFATFALANSLAGFLLAWFPLGLGLFLGAESERSERGGNWGPVRWSLRLASLLSILLCLILTQSRTAYVGLVVACLGPAAQLMRARRGAWIGEPRGGRWSRVIPLWLAGAVVAGGMVVGFERGKIDEKLVTQAMKSLEYRWQYWQGTAQLIRHHFWTGTGLGNFRTHYLRYKLAESSEEIADPHNLVLELWGTSGVLAATALVVTFGMVMWRLCRVPSAAALTSPPDKADLPVLVWAGLIAWSLAAFLSPLDAWHGIATATVWCGAAAVFALGSGGWKPVPAIIGWSVAALLVHLLGAGGIGMPGVAQSLWALAALGVTCSEGDRPARELAGGSTCLALMVGSTTGVVLFSLWVVRPVTSGHLFLRQGLELRRAGDLGSARTQYRRAVDADPLWAEPWVELARMDYEEWRGGRGAVAQSAWERAVRSLGRAVALAPSRVDLRRMLGSVHESRAKQEPSYWARAIMHYEECVELYPTSASLRARLGIALCQGGERSRGKEELREALRLDRGTEHPDKKLGAEERKRVEFWMSGR